LSHRGSLLEAVQGLLERTYRMRARVGDVAPFVIGDAGYRRLYAGSEEIGSPSGRARTLVRETAEGVRVCIYYPDALVRRLERYPPQAGLCDDNVDSFATLVEELDHLLMIAERTAAARPVTLFELELHGNVSKHLVLSRFAAGRGGERLDAGRRMWLRRRLFENVNDAVSTASARERYRDAARWAVKFIDRLGALNGRRRLRVLRGFHAANARGKLNLIRELAAA